MIIRCSINHLKSNIILPIVYVDDIIIRRDDGVVICFLKSFSQTRFHTKDLNQLKYFSGVKVTRSKEEMFYPTKSMPFTCLQILES